MATLATVTDLEARWRPLSELEAATATALLDDAWSIIRSRVPSIDARLAGSSESVDEQLVIAIECAMVLRVLRNPDGKRQESIDDYSWTRDNAVSAGLLYLSDDELTMLSPAGASSASFTVRPGGTPGWAQPHPWVYTHPSDQPYST